jgi:hypothetical protein
MMELGPERSLFAPQRSEPGAALARARQSELLATLGHRAKATPELEPHFVRWSLELAALAAATLLAGALLELPQFVQRSPVLVVLAAATLLQDPRLTKALSQWLQLQPQDQ